MLHLVLSPPHTPPLLSSQFPSSLSTRIIPQQRKKLNDDPIRRRRRGKCYVELSGDVPFAIAIGGSILSSLVIPVIDGGGGGAVEEEGERAGVIGADDSRFAIMGIISLIPYFNWLSWVFALMDTGKRRYAVYAIVYLAPYFRSNLSLSPEESWIPIASIILCIVHVQLEASISSGDLDVLQFLNETVKQLSSTDTEEDAPFHGHGSMNEIKRKGKAKDRMNLPTDPEHRRDEIRKWKLPRTPSQQIKHENEDEDAKGKGKH
ncbi:hypothetical protein Droror1_Dr00015517 [Drosera rotundifolia]